MFQFLALHRPSNGPWTKRPLPSRTMSRGPPPPTRYISRLWAAITIQEDTRNWKKNLPGGLPSYKSYDTGAGFSKKPRSWVAKRAHLETWDLTGKTKSSRPADRRNRIHKWSSDLSRLNIGNTLTLGTGAWELEQLTPVDSVSTWFDSWSHLQTFSRGAHLSNSSERMSKY